MGCVPTKPSMHSPPRGLEKLKLQNEYVPSGGLGGKPTSQKQVGRNSGGLFGQDPKIKGKKDVKVGADGDGDGEQGRLIMRGEREVGNVPKRIPSSGQIAVEELVDGWPKWLVDNIPREVLMGLVPKSAESFDMLDKIGQGTYSNVYKARDRETGKIVALKKVRFDTSESESVKFMAREIMILQKLDHPNIVKLEGLATSRMHYSLYLVFEFMHSDLMRIISHTDQGLTESQVKRYMQQLLSGLQHCHERGILHRDIKGSNLLIDKNGMLKIADFGLAYYFHPKEKRPMTSRVVTLWYRAPELLLGATNYGVGIDLWSVGCLLAEMFAGMPIMPGRTEVEQLHRIFKLCGSPSEDYWKKLKLPTSFRPPQPYKPSLQETFRDFPSSSLGLLARLLALDPAYRGSASSALKNEFFSTSPLACDLSGLPVIFIEEDEPIQTHERRKHRSSKMKHRSRTCREGHKRKENGSEGSKGDSGSSKEDPNKKEEWIFPSHEVSSSTGSTSSSVKPSKHEESPPPSPFLTVLSHHKILLKSNDHLNGAKNIKNPPLLPASKASTINYEDYETTYKLTFNDRSISTRDFWRLETPPLIPTPKESTPDHKQDDNKICRLTSNHRSISTRDYWRMDQSKMSKLYTYDG